MNNNTEFNQNCLRSQVDVEDSLNESIDMLFLVWNVFSLSVTFLITQIVYLFWPCIYKYLIFTKYDVFKITRYSQKYIFKTIPISGKLKFNLIKIRSFDPHRYTMK